MHKPDAAQQVDRFDFAERCSFMQRCLEFCIVKPETLVLPLPRALGLVFIENEQANFSNSRVHVNAVLLTAVYCPADAPVKLRCP